MSFMAQLCGFVLCAFIGLLAATIIAWIWMGKIDLSQLISEPSGDASMSRFQLLIFTFVIAISFFVLVEGNHGALPDIPNGVLTLLGISASTYAVSKGISYSQPQLLTPQAGSAADTGAGDGNAADAQAAAEEAAAHAAAAQQAAADIKASVSQIAVHAATVQQAMQQTAVNAAKAQQAADQATGSKS
ncbi:MAG TPA: hypothetical protein VE779_08655 [Candidatus Angelobacter sp.]|jgi:hypothetical protein|nr:hypothetical protein [Candidatus Angelobacter sp.]